MFATSGDDRQRQDHESGWAGASLSQLAPIERKPFDPSTRILSESNRAPKRLETFIEKRLAHFAAQGRPYYLAQLGNDLSVEFPGASSVYKCLGYDQLVTLLKTISSVRVAKVSGADRVERVTHPIPGQAFGSL